MVTIMVEGALFIAFLAVAVALVAYGVLGPTPVRGYHHERDLARLPGGAATCPECYAEVFHDEPH